MKIRPARCSNGLEGAMAQAAEVHSREELLAYLRSEYGWMAPTAQNVTVQKYGQGIDERIGWDTHLVSVDGKAALFTDGPLP